MLIVGLVLAALVALGAMAVVWPLHRARRLLASTSSVHFGRSTPTDLSRLLGPPARQDGTDCAHNTCTLVWLVNNRVLATLRLAPPTAVNVGVVVMAGTAQAVWASLASRDSAGELHGAMLTLETLNDLVANAPATGAGPVPDYTTFSAVVRLAQVPHFPITPNCLVRPGGCRNAGDVLPWVDWAAAARQAQ